MHGAVDSWPLTLNVQPPVELVRQETMVCLALPSNFLVGNASREEPLVMAPDRTPVKALAKVCFAGGRCVTWDTWVLRMLPSERFYCLTGSSTPKTSPITSVRIEATGPLQADSVWIHSYDPR